MNDKDENKSNSTNKKEKPYAHAVTDSGSAWGSNNSSFGGSSNSSNSNYSWGSSNSYGGSGLSTISEQFVTTGSVISDSKSQPAFGKQSGQGKADSCSL